MTREEAIRILDPETSRDALWKYENEGQRLDAYNEACRIAADVLRGHDTTLDGTYVNIEWFDEIKAELDALRAQQEVKGVEIDQFKKLDRSKWG